MTKRMLVDATHPEETRVAIVDSYRDHNRLDDLDFDLASKPILRGNIYLAKVMRIEPSLQAAFVEYGGNRHGFLPFSEIHPDYFRIPVADRSQEEESDQAEEQDQSYPEEDLSAYEGEEVSEGDEAAEAEEDRAANAAPEAVAPGNRAEENPEESAHPTETQPIQTSAEDPIFGTFGEADPTVGLITDFGNAVVPPVDLPSEEAAHEPMPVENVGGEMTERFVRQSRPRYKIQEVLKRGQIMLIQVVKEERGNKGAALTSYLSLAGRYCVLMPNTDHGGGVSRKITNHQDRRRMKEILDQLEIPEGMAVILRTAGMEQAPPDIQRDLEYLLRLWDNIREQTLQSSAPALIYEEANLIKRAVRDLYTQDIHEILVAGQEGYKRAHDFMQTIMPDQLDKIRLYEDPIPLFFRYQVESQIDALHSPVVQLRSGGYLVINPTEALVSIDVNSGRATRERHIEETAVKTNLEAAEEIARQLRLRDLAGLVVIDFIDMEDNRNNAAVERRMKEAMKNDRARLQIGRISLFGLMELSRQRLRPSLVEINFEKCPHCGGVGYVRSPDSAALSVLRAIEEEGIRGRSAEIVAHLPTRISLYILNQKRDALTAIEKRYDLRVSFRDDDTLTQPDYRIERVRNRAGGKQSGPAVNTDEVFAEAERAMPAASFEDDGETRAVEPVETRAEEQESDNRRGNRRRPRRKEGHSGGYGRRERGLPQSRQAEGRSEEPEGRNETAAIPADEDSVGNRAPAGEVGDSSESEQDQQRRRRRGRRGGRRRNGRDGQERKPREQGDDNARPYTPAPQVAPIPASVHELDTTPKPYGSEPPRSSQPSPSSHEIVNPPTERPKGGWWKRLTGQE